jgi:hypothetical protein
MLAMCILHLRDLFNANGTMAPLRNYLRVPSQGLGTLWCGYRCNKKVIAHIDGKAVDNTSVTQIDLRGRIF